MKAILWRVTMPVKLPSVNALYRTTVVPGARVLGPDPRAWGLRPHSLVVVAPDGTLRLGFLRRALTGEARSAAKAIRFHLRAAGVKEGSGPPPNTRVFVRLWLHGSWTTQAGDLRISDLANREKLLTDTVADYLGLQRPLRQKGGDEAVFFMSMAKVEDEAEGVTVEFGTMERKVNP